MERDSLYRFDVCGFVNGRYFSRSFICLKQAYEFFDRILDKENFSMLSLFDFYDEENPTSFKVLRVAFG